MKSPGVSFTEMIRIEGRGGRFCDGVSRRGFLRIGGLAMGGLSLPGILAAQDQSPRRGKSGGLGHKALIMVYLPGGPPHQDMFDLKMDAPSEIRGEFKPIPTNVAGIQVCELLPRLAGMMDKLVPIRSIVGAKDRHESFQCLTGRLNENLPRGGWPELGAVVSRLQGGTERTVPPFLALSPRMQHRPYNNGTPGFLGPAHAPFTPEAEGKGDLTLTGVTPERLEDRKRLLAGLDGFRRDVDAQGMMEGLDAYTAQAFGMLTSSRLAKALDLSKEDPRVVERYDTAPLMGRIDTKWNNHKNYADHGRTLGRLMLMARRLCENGCGFVTVTTNFVWDFHADVNNATVEEGLRYAGDPFDHAVSAFIEDVESRGLSDKILLVACGEMGRTPRINAKGGRDHWGKLGPLLLYGGGLKRGRVIGSSTKDAGEPNTDAVTSKMLIGTILRTLLDVGEARLLSGLPTELLALINDAESIKELT
jgi:hypothetical protein